MSMKSLTSIGIGLSVVFTCLLLALVAEIYYLLWWKRRVIMNNREYKDDNRSNNSNPMEFCFKYCWKRPYKSSIDSTRVADAQFRQHQILQENNSKQDYLVKPLEGENGVLEGELMIMGPPRFLFTINEETKEDLLEYEERKSKISLSDLLNSNNNNNAPISPFLTPISSPPFLTPVSNHSSQSGNGYNPLYEASSDAEFSKIVKLSPPPKFKFLRDAEEKLQKKLTFMEEAKLERDFHKVKVDKNARENGSFISIVVDDNNNNKDDKPNHHYYYHFPRSHNHSGDSSSTSTSTSCSSSTLASSSNRKFKSFLTM